jgi:hypothetical protein
MTLYDKVIKMRTEERINKCANLGVSCYITPERISQAIEKEKHKLVLAQLETYGVVSNVIVKNGRKMIINDGRLMNVNY